MQPDITNFFKSSGFSYIQVSLKGEILFANENAAKLYGYNLNDIIGKSFTSLFVNKKSKESFEACLRKPEIGFNKDNDSIYEVKSGSGAVLTIMLQMSIDIENKLIHCISKDITEYKINKDLFDIISENSSDVLWKIDKNLCFTFISKSVKRVLGYEPKEVIGKSVLDLSTSDLLTKIQLQIANRMKNMKENKNISYKSYIETGFYHVSGEVVPCEVNTMPILNDDGEIIEYTGSTRDISERQAANKAIKAANKELEQQNDKLKKALLLAEKSEKLKSAFLSNVSHEIRTPLNAILGFSSLLKSNAIPEEKKSYFAEVINSNGHQLLQIIDSIVDLSKIEAEEISINKTKFSINKLIDDLDSKTKKILSLHKKNLSVIIEKAMEDSQDIIYADNEKIEHVFEYLIDNAVKFTSEGSISLGYFIQNKKVHFYVKDTGIGIEKSNQDMVFDSFRQVDGSTTRDYSGVGLGLTIAKGFVELMGGEVKLESDINEGVLVTFSFNDDILVQTTIEQNKKEIDWSSVKAIIVEDDLSSAQYLELELEILGVKSIHFDLAQNAINYIKEGNAPDVILMDLMLPEISGYDAIKLIKIINPGIPIIAQTANAFSESIQRAKSSGCDEFISKPIDMGHLISKMESLLLK